jgi:hydrogenase expression/formation protein HypC
MPVLFTTSVLICSVNVEQFPVANLICIKVLKKMPETGAIIAVTWQPGSVGKRVAKARLVPRLNRSGRHKLFGDELMCLALPVKVIEIGCGPSGEAAMVDLGGVKKEISLALLDDVQVGDYVILHVGYALSKLDPQEAERTLALFSDMNAMAVAAA